MIRRMMGNAGTRMLIAVLVCCAVISYSAKSAQNDQHTAGTGQQELPICTGEEYEGILPVGSVVLLKNSEVKLMIMGFLQALEGGEAAKIYDYCGCLFPSGYESADQVYLFDHEQIEGIYYIGYQNQEQADFMDRLDAIMMGL